MAGVALLLAATACSGATTVSLSPGGRPSPDEPSRPAAELIALARDVPCARTQATASVKDLAAFQAVAAVSCSQLPRELPHDGQWLVDVRRVATSGVGSLQAAYELPTQHATNVTCAGVAIVAPNVALVDAAGSVLVPAVPRDACGQPRGELLEAFRSAAWQEVSVHKVRQLVTPRAEAAGCDMRWKNENALATEFGTHVSRGGRLFLQQPSTLHVCLFRVLGSDMEIGDFKFGFDLSGAQVVALAKALEGAGPGHACPAQRAFAVVQTESGQTANVELGGCWRVQRPYPDAGIGTADAGVVQGLLARAVPRS